MIGQALHLHRDLSGRLWGVFDAHAPVADNELFVSVETRADGPADGPQTDIEITGAALVTRTAQTCLQKARYLDGELAKAEAREAWRLSDIERHVIDTAAAAVPSKSTTTRLPRLSSPVARVRACTRSKPLNCLSGSTTRNRTNCDGPPGHYGCADRRPRATGRQSSRGNS